MHCFALEGLLSLASLSECRCFGRLKNQRAFYCFLLLPRSHHGGFSPNTDLADLLNEMLSVQERLRKHGVSFGTGLPGPPAGQPEAAASSTNAPAGAYASGTASRTTGLQHRVDLFPTFWGEPVSAFHSRLGYSAKHVAASL